MRCGWAGLGRFAMAVEQFRRTLDQVADLAALDDWLRKRSNDSKFYFEIFHFDYKNREDGSDDRVNRMYSGYWVRGFPSPAQLTMSCVACPPSSRHCVIMWLA